MLARASFEPYAASDFVLSHAGYFRALNYIPYRYLHRSLVGLSWLETWLRWPLRTMRMTDALEAHFSRIDPAGEQFGLTPKVRERFRHNRLLLQVPDLAVLLVNLDSARFRRRAIAVESHEALLRAKKSGPGAIVVGFRIGPYPVVPLALAGLGHDVSMIVGGEPMADIGQQMGEKFTPRLARRIRYVNSMEKTVLAQAMSDLNDGRIACTLLEMSPIKYAKTTPVRFLGYDISVAYGIPYLAAMTQRSIVPLVMTREPGPRFRMHFLEALAAPSRDKQSILATTQDLWSALEQQVLRYPDQWIGWTRLESHLAIDLQKQAQTLVPARS